MPGQPAPEDLHVDSYLTNLAVGWSQAQARFIAGQIFPVVPVAKKSDIYPIFDKGFFYRDEVRVRPLGGENRLIGYEVSNGTYNCEEEGVAHRVDDRVRANFDRPLDPDRAAMRLLTTQAMIHRDVRFAARYFTTGVWGTDLTGVAASPAANEFIQFDLAGSDPIGLIERQKERISLATGYEPNRLLLGARAWRTLKNHDDVLDRIKHTQRGIVTQELLAALLEIERVVVSKSVQNTAAEGATNVVGSILDPDDMLLVYSAPAPSIDEPSGGYIFAWTGLIPGVTNAFGGVIQRGRVPRSYSDHFDMRYAFDPRLVAAELGVYFDEAVSAAA